MLLNKPKETEYIEVVLTEKKYPIAFRNKLRELMEQGAFKSESDARRWIASAPIVLELYYEPHAGLFAVESDALESSPESIRSPYSGEPFQKQTETREDEPFPYTINPETKLNRLPLSTKTQNCLQGNGINTFRVLTEKSKSELLHIRNFGKKCLDEVESFINHYRHE